MMKRHLAGIAMVVILCCVSASSAKAHPSAAEHWQDLRYVFFGERTYSSIRSEAKSDWQAIEQASQICIDQFGGSHKRMLECVALLSKLDTPQHIDIDLELDELDITSAESKATYQEIKDYVLEHSGLKVSSLYIAQVKQKHGIIERECYNVSKSEGGRVPQCPPEKEKAIEDALKHFGMI